MNQSQIQTRSHNYLRTRSGKRYFRDVEPDDYYGVVYHDNKKSKHVQFEEPETLPVDFMEDGENGFHSDTSLPENENTYSEQVCIPGGGEASITVTEVPYEEWEETVKTALRDTFQMTEEELQEYPFYNWFLCGRDPIEVANAIKRDFYRDEDDLYRQPFLDWRREVDSLLRSKMSMGILDIPDFPYYDYFIDTHSPVEMVNYIMSELIY